MLSGRRLCDELIARPEESYRLWCVVVCDLETSEMRRPWPTGGLSRPPPKENEYSLFMLSGRVVLPWLLIAEDSAELRNQTNETSEVLY